MFSECTLWFSPISWRRGPVAPSVKRRPSLFTLLYMIPMCGQVHLFTRSPADELSGCLQGFCHWGKRCHENSPVRLFSSVRGESHPH